MSKFYAIEQKDEKMLMERISDDNALHVILFSPNLPCHWIIWDGEKYWLFNASSHQGWAQRIEYRGYTATLRVCSPHIAAAIAHQFPFKLRRIPLNYSMMMWKDYLNKINDSI